MDVSPNEKPVAFYDGDTLVWLTPPEYYQRVAGAAILRQLTLETDECEPI